MVKIIRMTCNWFSNKMGEVRTEYDTNSGLVDRIEEHLPAIQGDRLYYKVYLSNGDMVKIFNPDKVYYSEK